MPASVAILRFQLMMLVFIVGLVVSGGRRGENRLGEETSARLKERRFAIAV
jgi:uncharacterized membrane protein YhaH (DUF805 family)